MSWQCLNPEAYQGDPGFAPEFESDRAVPCSLCGDTIDLDDDEYVGDGHYAHTDCAGPRCEAVGCTEPLADGDESDSCLLHNWEAAIEDADPWPNIEQQARIAKWAKACIAAGIEPRRF
jgi:hypothetical protein